MKKQLLIMALPLSLSVLGTSYAAQTKTEKLEDQFIASAQAYLDKSDYAQICTQLFPEPIVESSNQLVSAEQLHYLQEQGLLNKQDGTYVLTDKAEPFVKRNDDKKISRLCFASPKITAIEGVPSEDSLGEQKSVRTTITLEPQNVAPWVKLPEFLKAFPEFAEMFNQPSTVKGPATFEKTENGWQLRGLH